MFYQSPSFPWACLPQQVLAASSDPLLVEETARFANAMASDRLGRSYLGTAGTGNIEVGGCVDARVHAGTGSIHVEPCLSRTRSYASDN